MEQKSNYLIGDSIENIDASKPPTLREVLQCFRILHNEKRMQIKQSISEVIKIVRGILLGLGIEPKLRGRYEDKLAKIYAEYQSIVKNRFSATDSQKARRERFNKQLNEVFDIKQIDIPTSTASTSPVSTPCASQQKTTPIGFECNDSSTVPFDQFQGESSKMSQKRSSSTKAREKLKEMYENRPYLPGEMSTQGNILQMFAVSSNV